MVAAEAISADGMAAGASGMRVATAAMGMEVAGMGADGTGAHIRTDGRRTGGGITLATRVALRRPYGPKASAPKAQDGNHPADAPPRTHLRNRDGVK